MKRLTKRQKSILEKVDKNKIYNFEDALKLLQQVKSPKFDETVEIVLRLGVDARKAEQMVRGACALPNGLGKTVRILVFAKGEKDLEAREAGADYVGGEDLVKKISEGWFDFDRVVASPDMMNLVGRIGKLLGPRGLMPNPKLGTVTFDIGRTVKTIKAGQVEFRVDKSGNLHAPIGRLSFEVPKLRENIQAFLDTVQRLKPATSKGVYMQSCTVSSTMGPGLRVDLQS